MAQIGAIVDKLLTQVSSILVPQGYISEEYFPGIQAAQNTGKLAKYGNEHLRIINTVMGGRGKAPRVDSITRSSTTFEIEDHGLEGIVTASDKRNVERPYNAKKDEVLGLSTILWLGKEKALADAVTDTAILTQNVTLAGTDQWSDYTNSDPLGDAGLGHQTIFDACGMHPSQMSLSRAVLNKVKYHTKVLDALGFKHNRAGLLSRDDIARAFDVQKLLVGEAVHNSANEGQTDSISSVWGKHVVFSFVPAVARPYQQSLGYYLTLQGESPRKVFKFAVNNPPESTGIIVTDHYDQLLSNVSCGYLIKDAVA